MDKKYERTIHSKENTNGSQTNKMIFNLFYNKGNNNYNYNNTSFLLFLLPITLVMHVALARKLRTGSFIHCWWECNLVQFLWSTVLQWFQNVKCLYPLTFYVFISDIFTQVKWLIYRTIHWSIACGKQLTILTIENRDGISMLWTTIQSLKRMGGLFIYWIWELYFQFLKICRTMSMGKQNVGIYMCLYIFVCI